MEVKPRFRAQGAFPWLWLWPEKSALKRPGDEVGGVGGGGW